MRCGLTTPPFMQVLSTKRPNRCGIGARYCGPLCAARMTQFLLQLCAHFGSVFLHFDETVRAQVAQAGAATRAGCAHSSGSVWAMNVPGYGSSGAALCCARTHQHRCAHPSPIVVTYGLAVAQPCAWAGARRVARCNSFEIQTAWSICTAVRTVLRKDAHHMHAAVDSSVNEIVHGMCELPNYGRVIVATEVMALWRRSGDGRAFRTHAPAEMGRRTIHSGLSVGREEARRIVSGRSPTTRLLDKLGSQG